MKVFIERPIATAMVFLALFVLGLYSFLNIPLELAPKEEFPQLHIQTSWQGVPPEVIQTQITSPLEEVVSTVKGIKKLTSSSRIGMSTLTLDFTPKTNMEFARLALREKIRGIKDMLPYGVRPYIQPYIPENFQTDPFLSYTVSGNYSLQKLRELVKDKIENGIGSIKGVSQAEVTGGSDAEIRIVLDNEKIKALNVHPYLVQAKIQEISETYPGRKGFPGAAGISLQDIQPDQGAAAAGRDHCHLLWSVIRSGSRIWPTSSLHLGRSSISTGSMVSPPSA